MDITPGFIVAASGALIALLGWWREWRKDKRTEHRSDLDIVLSAYQQLLRDEASGRDRTKAELEEAMRRALDCEEREKALSDRVDLLDEEIKKLKRKP